MSSVNKVVAPRKLRVTVTVEEFDPPKSNDLPNSKELWTSVGSLSKKQIFNFNIENLRRLFWWIF
jgi:hypothetical protein